VVTVKATKLLAAVVAAVAAGALVAAGAADANSVSTYPLMAGGGNAANAVQVGTVSVSVEGDVLKVAYLLTGDLTPTDPSDDGVPTLIAKTHLAAVDDGQELTGGIPTSNGNPNPGQFAYQDIHSPGVSSFEYTLSLAAVDLDGDGKISLAVHADVQKLGGPAGFESLPASVSFQVATPGVGGLYPSYFDMTFLSGYSAGATVDSWCIDVERNISSGRPYTGTAYSGFEALPAGAVDKPENMDLVTWLINSYHAGQAVTADINGDLLPETRTLTSGDVQLAIWLLIDNDLHSPGPPYSLPWAQWLAAQAAAEGENFVPGCGGQWPVVIVPTTSPEQQTVIATATLAQLGIPCTTSSATAWASMGTTSLVAKKLVYDNAFPGKNWAAWISYQAPVPV
jgi:hypothetical protein